MSCVLYLASRVPQVFHNFATRCEGLSLAMFFFSISGSKSALLRSENLADPQTSRTSRRSS
jgi:hypothetical protein